MQEITIPRRLVPLVKAFSAEPAAAKTLIIEAAKTVMEGGNSYSNSLSPEELEGVVALMKGLEPRDTLEQIYAAQIVASHLMGMRMLQHDFTEDKNMGIKLLRFSNEAMLQFQKKRSGNINQTITVNYNYGQKPIETIIPEQG